VVVGGRGDLFDLVVERAWMLFTERRERVLDPLTLLEKRVGLPLWPR
jgi:hypothetical protein